MNPCPWLTHALILLLFLLTGTPAQAGRFRQLDCVLTALSPSKDAYLDSSVEMELPMTSQVLRSLTTRDGTLEPLQIRNIPEAISERFPKLDPQKIRWDALTEKEQMILLKEQARGSIFLADRRIPGLRVRPEIKLTFSEKPYTRFRGQLYPPGTYTFDLSKEFATGKVEYRHPNDVKSVTGVELHFRSGRAAGDNLVDAWAINQGLGIDRKHMHVHIPGLLRTQDILARPVLETAKHMEFIRRGEILSQMVSIVESRLGVSTNGMEFHHLWPGDINRITKVFMEFATQKAGPELKALNFAEKGWIGARGSTSYDAPGLWGLEYRAAHRSLTNATGRTILNGVQQTIADPEFGLSPGLMGRWLERFAGSGPREQGGFLLDGKFSEATLPMGLSHALRPNLPFHVPLEVPAKLRETAEIYLKSLRLKDWPNTYNYLARHHAEVFMLLHDWARDPLVFESAEKIVRIENAQLQGLRALIRGEKPVETVRGFLLESGLYQDYMNSTKIKMELLEP